MRRVFLVAIIVGMFVGVSCKKKTEDDNNNNNNNNSGQVADIHGDWVGKWTNSQSGDVNLIHLTISQSAETVAVKVVFDSLYQDTFYIGGRLDDNNHIEGYAVSTTNDTLKCVFKLTYNNDTLLGSYTFSPGNNGSWWAVRGTHLVEPGWNYFGEVAGYPNDVFFSQDATLYIASTSGFFSSDDYGMSFELIDTTAFYSICDAGGILYGAGFGFVLKSSDGGNTWQDITPSGFVGGSGTLVRFSSSNEGYILTGDDVYSTSDGGDSWTFHENVLPGLVQGAFATSSDLYAVGYVPGQTIGGFASVSSDGGNTWTALNIPQEDSVAELYSVYVDGNNIVLGGKKAKASSGDHDLRIVLYSTDDGNTFEKETFTGTPPHDEWIGTVLYNSGTVYAANVYPSSNVMVYSFGGTQAVDTLPYVGGSSKALLKYDNGDLGLVITTSSGNSAVFYFKNE